VVPPPSDALLRKGTMQFYQASGCALKYSMGGTIMGDELMTIYSIICYHSNLSYATWTFFFSSMWTTVAEPPNLMPSHEYLSSIRH